MNDDMFKADSSFLEGKDPRVDFAREEMLSAHISAIRRSIVPLVGEESGQAGIWGTATLFEDAGHHFLVTAAHVARDIERTRRRGGVVGYVRDDSQQIPIPLDGIKVLQADEDGREEEEYVYDVALLELEDPQKIAELKRSKRFITRENIAPHFVHKEAVYLVFGYPTRLVETPRDSEADYRPALIITGLYNGPIPQTVVPVIDGVHVLLKYKSVGEDLNGSPKKTIPLGGISGCSIWTCTVPANERKAWTPERDSWAVGIETGIHEDDKWIRCTSWSVALKLLDG